MPQMLAYADWVKVPIPGSDLTWVDYDLNNAGVPADAIGVICYYRRDTSAPSESIRCGIRPNGSTDDGTEYYQVYERTSDAYHRRNIMMCACDGNKLIETFMSAASAFNASDGLFVAGWILSGEAVMLTNTVAPTWSSGPSANTWNEAHFDSAITSGTPQAWICRVSNKHWNADSFQPRPSGSTYNFPTSYQYDNGLDFITGVGTNNRLEIWPDDTTNWWVGVRGYFTSGYTSLYDNPISYNPSSGDTWDTINVPGVPANALAICEADSTASGSKLGVRSVGSTDTDVPRQGPGPVMQLIDVGANQQIQAYRNYNINAYITGYLETGPAPTPPLSYDDLTYYFDTDIGSEDLSAGWTDHDPNGFTADQLPEGLSLSPQGILTGTPVCPPESVPSYLWFGGDTIIVTPVILDPNKYYTIQYTASVDAAGGNRAACGCGTLGIAHLSSNAMGVRNWGNDSGAATYVQNSWDWVVGKFINNSTAEIYTPGDWATGLSRGSTSSNSEPFVIGAIDQAFSAYGSMVGTMAAVYIYEGDKDAGGTLIHYWEIDDDSTTIIDSVGGQHGTLTIGSGVWTPR